MKTKPILIGLLSLILLTGCSLPSNTPPTITPPPIIFPSPTLPLSTIVIPIVTTTPLTAPTPTGVFVPATAPNPATSTGPIVGVTPVPVATFCADAQVTPLIESLKTALQTSNGALLASLTSPAHGMEVRYYRDGRTVIYDQAHAKFLFESSFEVNWGDAPGSGLPTTGSFHEVVIPDLLKLFNSSYTLTCNQLQVGGTTYQAAWPYAANYYSVYYAGTQANGNMDWLTWLVGFEYVNGRPYLYALMPFRWEP
jgi:hypothetical protein